MVIGFWVLIVFSLLYEPIMGYYDFQNFKNSINKNARIKYYVKIILGLWVPTILILLIIVFTELKLSSIGLKMPTIDTQTLGSYVTYTIFGIASLYIFFLFYYLIGNKFSNKIRMGLSKAKEKQMENADFSIILPSTKEEKKLWNYVSLTAGVTEEIIYRGFLIFALSYLFSSLSIWVVILISSLLFGLAHTYQGLLGVLRTTIFGIIFSILYIGLGSIFPLIILHFLMDYVAKLGDDKTYQT